MKSFGKRLGALILGTLASTLCCIPAYGDICTYSAAGEIQSDLEDAQSQKAKTDVHLQKIKDMERSVEENPNTSPQTVDTLNRAEAADLDAIKKINEQIEADQACLQDKPCTRVVYVANIRGHVVVAEGEYVQDAGAVCRLRPGDQLSTGMDGSADLVILGGRRIIHMGPNSVFKMPAASIVSHLLEDPESQLISILGVRG